MTRRLVKLSRSKGKSFYFSKKNDCIVKVESFNERNYALRLEYRDDVTSYCCQPETCHTDFGERTPDFLVKLIDGSFEYVEVHWHKNVDDEYLINMQKFNDYFVTTSNRPFKLVLDTDLNEFETQNLDFLYNYRGINWPHKPHILPKKTTYNDLISCCKDSCSLSLSEAMITALALIADGQYQFDLFSLLKKETLLEPRI
jgi:hypothetical protein